MIKKFIFIAIILFVPFFVSAQTLDNAEIKGDQIFKAKVIKILEERQIERADGSSGWQQNLLFLGLEKDWTGKEIESFGISDIDLVKSNIYKVGDKVLLSEITNFDGSKGFYIVDFYRSNYLYWLAGVFAVIIVLIGKVKGIKSLVSLVVSFFVIIKFIIPSILNGHSPLTIGVLGTLIILSASIYLTEGWGRKSHVAVLSVLCSLVITFIFSYIFTYLTRLTGLAQEEAVFLLGVGNGAINFKGLLLAGILIGTVGVLDDVIVGQVEAVRQIKQANPNLTHKQVYKSAYEIGNAHLGAIVNTLFLTYTGASLPLLLLFSTSASESVSFAQAINNEMIATEIVRALVGSIGVALAMPVATFLASVFIKND